MKYLYVFTFLLLLLMSPTQAFAQPDALGTVARLAKQGDSEDAHTRHFFNDVSDSVSFYMEHPEQVKYYTDQHAFRNPARLSIASAPLCKDVSGLESDVSQRVVEAYNKSESASVTRKNFWIAVSSCLAGHEGAEAWESNGAMTMNKLDVPGIRHRKYLYGIFQLSTERGAGVDDACQPAWANFKVPESSSGSPKEYIAKQRGVPTLGDLQSKGTSPTNDSMAALGDIKNQRFNIMCGIHEIFRASAGSGGSCLDPFNHSQNRYGPLRSQTNAYKKCINRLVEPVMNAGDNVANVRTAIQLATGTKTEVDAEKNHAEATE